MAIVIKRRISGEGETRTPLSAFIAAVKSIPSAIAENLGAINGKADLLATPPELVGKQEPALTPREVKKLTEAGLIEAGDQKKYPTVNLYERVTITNSMFPWIKHYRPGDSGTIKHISNNKDPLGFDDEGYLMHIIEIDQPTDKSRLGQTACLFRWEFEKHKPMGEIPSRVISK